MVLLLTGEMLSKPLFGRIDPASSPIHFFLENQADSKLEKNRLPFHRLSKLESVVLHIEFFV